MGAKTGESGLIELGLLHEEVEAARAVLMEVEGRRCMAAVAAVQDGAPKRRVAFAAGVTRQTLDRWLGAWQRTS